MFGRTFFTRTRDVEQKDFVMNKNQIDGGMKEAEGKVQKTAGNIEEKAKNIAKEARRPV